MSLSVKAANGALPESRDQNGSKPALAARRPSRLMAFLASQRLVVLTVLAMVLVIGGAMYIPHWIWLSTPVNPLRVVVVNKTVPFPGMREHRALFWLLTQNRFVDPSRPTNDQLYRFDKDYNGFHPTETPYKFTTDLLTSQSLKGADALIFTDTYGVYDDDYAQFPGQEISATRHSPKLFGGLEGNEVAATEQFAQEGKLIIAEFNTLASPTPPALRARMEKIFGFTWTGWVGRYFVDFTDVKDVPDWLTKLRQQQTGQVWNLHGSGYMLCRNESQEFIILRDGADALRKGIELRPRGPYIVGDVMQGVLPNKCNYWFDIIVPDQGTEVLADYYLNLTEQGKQAVLSHKLPLVFPAVVRWRSGYTAYYIAGDLVDFEKAMGPPDSTLSLYLNRSYFRHPAPGDTGCFFWHTYYPLVSNILRLESRRITGSPQRALIFQ